MEDRKTPVEFLLERGQAYANTTIQLLKLKGAERFADIASKLASNFVILILTAIFFINLNIGIALFVGELLGKIWLGFLVVAAFYGIIAFFFYIFRDRLIKRRVRNGIIQELLKGEEFPDQDLF